MALKGKMDLAIAIAIGSSHQIALFVMPLIVILGWMLHVDNMDLDLGRFQILVIFVAVVLVNTIIQDGKSNAFEGVMLVALYSFIAVTVALLGGHLVLGSTSIRVQSLSL